MISGQIFLLFCHNLRVFDKQTDGRTDSFLVAREFLSLARQHNAHVINLVSVSLLSLSDGHR